MLEGQDKSIPAYMELENVLMCRDPRLKELGHRIIAAKHEDVPAMLKDNGINAIENTEESEYQQLRFLFFIILIIFFLQTFLYISVLIFLIVFLLTLQNLSIVLSTYILNNEPN